MRNGPSMNSSTEVADRAGEGRWVKFTDPQFGPVLSGLIWGLMLLIAFLVVTLPFSPNAGIAGGVIGTLAGLLGLAIQARGKIAERRKPE